MNPSRRTTDALLKANLDKAERLKAKIASLEARKRSEDRRRDARRKFVVGSAVLVHAERDPAFRDALRDALHAAVDREADRLLIVDLLGAQPDP